MNTQSYADLEIRILERQEAGYPVEIDLNHGHYYKRGFLDPTLPTWGDPAEIGERLFEWLFADDILSKAWEYVRGQWPQRHIRLRLDAEAPALHALPWESLCDPATSLDLAATDATPFSRFLAGEWSPGSPVLAQPLKMLVAIADPCDLPDYGLTELNADDEWQALQEATKGLDVALTRLPSPCTLAALETELRQGYHILHLIAHGKYNANRKRAALYLADSENYTTEVTEADFALTLKRQLADSVVLNSVQNDARLRLVFLASCEGAQCDTADAFRGLAPELVQAGVPAIVAMQTGISVKAARAFSLKFYRHLLDHGLVDLAGNQARAALLTAGSTEAATPVLFMRLPDGKLWETTQAAARRDFYTHAPRLEPERYVNRPHEYAQIKTLLLAEPTSEGLTTALCGAGGFGKTTLARVLCDDAEVQARFSDGILWATLGESPDVLTRLREWVTALGGIISENAPTIPQLVNRLTDLLRDGDYLLLIDDVWDSAALTPFLCGGPRCAHLATTRNRATLPANVQAVAVDTMRSAEAVALLGYGLVAEAPESTALQTLAQRLGHWPLLLWIINGVLREMRAQGASLADALAYVAEGLTEEGLTVFDAADATDRARAVGATMEVSLRRLADADRARYTELAIFPEDTDIPATAAARLWGQTGGLSAFKTKDLFRQLGSASLVQTYNAEHQTVRLHDVVRVYLAGALGTEGYAAAHRALLNAYRQTVTVNAVEGSPTPWHTAPDDGYLYTHLAYHLDALAATDDNAAVELADLFATDAWLHVRVATAGYTYDGYLADLEYTWQRAEAQVCSGTADALAECVRCALIRTTVNSLAYSYDPELVARAVEIGAWSPARAVSLAAKVPDTERRLKIYTLLLKLDALMEEQRAAARRGGLAAAQAIASERVRAKALAALAPHLPGDLLAEGLAAAQAIASEWVRAEALAALAPHLTGDLLAEGLSAVRAIADEGPRAEALAALAPYLTGDLLAEGLSAVRAIADEGPRAQALAAMALHLTGDLRKQTLVEGLVAAQAIEAEGPRAEALAALAPYLTGDLLAEGLSAVRAIADEGPRAEALAALAPHLTSDLLAEGLVAAQAIASERVRAKALAALAPHLPGDLLAEGLAAAQAIASEWVRAEALAALAPHLTSDLLAEGLSAVQAIASERVRAEALAALAPHLTGGLLSEGLAAARAIGIAEHRAAALVVLVSKVTGPARDRALAEGLAAARAIEDKQKRAYALAALVPQLKGNLRGQVLSAGLETARAIEDEWQRAWALPDLVLQLTGTVQEQALAESLAAARAIDIWKTGSTVWLLEMLALQLPEHLREQALAAWLAVVRAIEDEWDRAPALAKLAPHLTGNLLAEGLTAARTIGYEWPRAEALAALAPYLTRNVLVEGLAAARAINDEWHQANGLTALASHLTGAAQEQALVEGLAAARAIVDEFRRAWALTALVPYLTGDLLAEGLTAARTIKDECERFKVLMAMAPQLTGAAKEQALAEGLAAASAITDKFGQVKAVTMLASQLTDEAREQVLPEVLPEVLAKAQAIADEYWRARALIELTPYLTGNLLVEGFAAARAIANEFCRALALIELAPYLTGNLLVEGFAAARAIADEFWRARALIELASQLTGEAREQVLAEVLAAAQAIADESQRARVLIELAPYLTGDLLAMGLAAAQIIPDEWNRAETLTALVPQLTGEARERALTEGLAAARTIEWKPGRAQALTALLPHFTGAAAQSVGKDYRAAILAALRAIENNERKWVLCLIANKSDFGNYEDVFKPDALGLTPAGVVHIARAVIDICRRWEWL